MILNFYWTTNWLTYRHGSARTGYPLGRLLYRTRVYPVPPRRLYVNLYILLFYYNLFTVQKIQSGG